MEWSRRNRLEVTSHLWRSGLWETLCLLLWQQSILRPQQQKTGQLRLASSLYKWEGLTIGISHAVVKETVWVGFCNGQMKGCECSAATLIHTNEPELIRLLLSCQPIHANTCVSPYMLTCAGLYMLTCALAWQRRQSEQTRQQFHVFWSAWLQMWRWGCFCTLTHWTEPTSTVISCL